MRCYLNKIKQQGNHFCDRRSQQLSSLVTFIMEDEQQQKELKKVKPWKVWFLDLLCLSRNAAESWCFGADLSGSGQEGEARKFDAWQQSWTAGEGNRVVLRGAAITEKFWMVEKRVRPIPNFAWLFENVVGQISVEVSELGIHLKLFKASTLAIQNLF